MPTHKTPADEIAVSEIAVSIVCLRNARAEFANVAQPHDRHTFKARIDLCDELINRVDEINRNLRQLTSDLRANGDIQQYLVGRNEIGSPGTS
jgi:hypothetical protein